MTNQKMMGSMLIVLGDGPSLTDWLTVVASILTLLVAILGLWYASRQIREAKLARQQVAALEREKAQPMVVAYMEMGETNFFMELVIKNFGQTPAYDVRFSSDKPLQQSAEGTTKERQDVLIPETIPFLAPGQAWRTIWDSPLHRSRDIGIEDRHEVIVKYRGLESEDLKSAATLDWSIQKAVSYTDTYGIHHVAKELKSLRSTHEKWTEKATNPGMKTWVRDGDAKDQMNLERREEIMREREENPPAQRSQQNISPTETDTEETVPEEES